MSSCTSAGPSPPPESKASPDFSCAICFDTATEPVVTKCGHLYCWSCLDSWLRRGELECPMCKGRISQDHPGDIIPLYGKGRSGPTLPTSRPAAPAPSHGSTPSPTMDPPHARPAANRETPPLRDGNRMRFNWGAQGGWGGGMFFMFASPSIIQWPMMLILIVCALIYKFAPWREWIGWEPRVNREGNERPAAEQQPQQPVHQRFTHFAMLIALFSFFIWIAGV